MQVIKDTNEDEVEVKKLGSPVKKTRVGPNTRVDDYSEDDVSGLNNIPEDRPSSSREAAVKESKKTLLGNMGPDKNGKIDWSKNPDCVDSILQYHEMYQFESTPEGF